MTKNELLEKLILLNRYADSVVEKPANIEQEIFSRWANFVIEQYLESK